MNTPVHEEHRLIKGFAKTGSFSECAVVPPSLCCRRLARLMNRPASRCIQHLAAFCLMQAVAATG